MEPKREIDVRNQESLPLGKALAFCSKGISHRLFRSTLTLAVVVLAVAFFMTLLTESAALKAAAKRLDKEMAVQREATVFMSKIFSPLTPVDASLALAKISGDKKAVEEMARVSGMSVSKIDELAADARFEKTYLDFFDKMGVGQKRILVKKNKGREIFRFLAEERNFRQFADMLEPLRSLKLPTPTQELKEFVKDYAAYERDIHEFSRRQGEKASKLESKTREIIMDSSFETWLAAASRDEASACAKLKAASTGQDEESLKAALWSLQAKLRKGAANEPEALAELAKLAPSKDELKDLLSTLKAGPWLCFAPETQLSRWREAVLAAGFDIDKPFESRLLASLRAEKSKDDVAALLSSKEMKAEWKKAFSENPPLDKKMEMLDDAQVVKMLSGSVDAEELAKLKSMTVRERKTSELERSLADRVDAKSGGVLSGRQAFLLGVSFLVCMVGIANAMLMAITERFREIATMKCLGATDGFILTQFLLEAALQGVCGGLLGMAIGLVLSVLKLAAALGPHALAGFPFLGALVCAVVSIAAGIALSMLASIYPSWSASRMAPMEAMRVE